VSKRELAEIPFPNEMFTCGQQAKSFSFMKNTINTPEASGSISQFKLSESFKVAEVVP
jgi:hypothetical protein